MLEDTSQGRPTVTISRRTPWFLALIAAIFLVLTAAAHLIFGPETSSLMGFRQLVDVDAEGNLPTWFSAALLHFAALVAWSISPRDKVENRLSWQAIAVLLLLMGIDEIASIHNAPSRIVGELFGNRSGIMMNAWVIPASILCLVVAIFFVRFLTRQPKWLAIGLITAAGLFVFGAIVLEMASTYVEYQTAGHDYDGETHYSLTFELIAVGEELFEYAGVILTISLLLRRGREVNAEIGLTV
ncbi:hypothetical protein NZK35_28700 [Stieleria sp. ICT_E10.1]|uniref:hypothetical protein n=1 Tax=Stieleria sedimenti TaxID=2976331 RepID=UPI0021807F6C|nr:hypothetical protein [Stieleria sedimenti]MCS7470650.1 hypothetical protein [Stieleria sedimenti]